MKSFTKLQLQDLKDYYEVLNLRERGYSRNKINEIIGVSIDKIHRWTRSKSKPTIIKILEEFSQRFDRSLSKNDMENIAYLVGYNLG